MGGLAGEAVHHGPERVAAGLPPAHAEARAHVGEEVHVDVVEDALPHEVRLGGDLLLGDARPDEERAVDVLPLHDLLHGQGGDDVDGLPGVVPLAVARRHGEDGIAVRHARLLVRLRDPVHVGAQGDDRLTGAVGPAGRPGRRHARHAELDLEALLLQQAGQVTLRLEFLHPQLAEAEEHVDDLLDELRPLLDQLEGLLLEGLQTGIGLGGGGVRNGGQPETSQGEQGEESGAHRGNLRKNRNTKRRPASGGCRRLPIRARPCRT